MFIALGSLAACAAAMVTCVHSPVTKFFSDTTTPHITANPFQTQDGASTDGQWSNLNLVTAKDLQDAWALSWTRTWTMWCEDFGFSIPSNATVVGVQATYYGITINSQAVVSTAGCNFQLANDHTQIGTAIFLPGLIFPGAASKDLLAHIGNSTDLWGATLTPALINSPNFGVTFYSNYQLPSTSLIKTQIDAVYLEVWYTTPSQPLAAMVRRARPAPLKANNAKISKKS